MKRPLLIVGVPAVLVLIALIVFTASFRVHVGSVGSSGAGGDLQGIFVHRDGKVCLGGPISIVSIWLGAYKLNGDPARRAFNPGADTAAFDVHWLGTDRQGWVDADDPAIQATWQALKNAGWPCRRY